MQWIGYFGVAALAACWIPQSIETIRQGKCGVNLLFLILAVIGSFSMMVYALSIDDGVFTILNALTTLGGLLNLYYKLFPRTGAVSG
jgi:MtN3 and saliva related transmembrane protein